jgi:hypothetical protein
MKADELFCYCCKLFSPALRDVRKERSHAWQYILKTLECYDGSSVHRECMAKQKEPELRLRILIKGYEK